MKKALSLPSVLGIKIYIHWTFSLLIAWIIFSNIKAGLDWLQTGWMILFILSLFVCVILHELGHAIAAKHYGIKTKNITLYPIGGIARLESIPSKPKQELVVAIAGPLVNIVIMLALSPFILNYQMPEANAEATLVIDASNFLPMLGIINVWLAVFNLIPAFPMDGGRMLRAFLATRMDRLKATEIASFIGKVLAILFVFVGFYVNPFLIFIGLFIFLGAHNEKEMVRTQSVLSELTAKDAMMTNYVKLHKLDPISKAVSIILDGEAKTFVVTDDNNIVGIIYRENLIKGLRDFDTNTPVEKIMTEDLNTVDINTPINKILMGFNQNGNKVVMVAENGKTKGMIDSENISELIMINEAKKQKT